MAPCNYTTVKASKILSSRMCKHTPHPNTYNFLRITQIRSPKPVHRETATCSFSIKSSWSKPLLCFHRRSNQRSIGVSLMAEIIISRRAVRRWRRRRHRSLTDIFCSARFRVSQRSKLARFLTLWQMNKTPNRQQTWEITRKHRNFYRE